MTEEQRQRLRNIKTFKQLLTFLRDDLQWPIEHVDDEDDLTFDWSDDLGLKDSERVGIKEIKQLRPLESGQQWGIFFINFEKKQLPIVILRRILNALVLKKRVSANKAQRATWQQHDLLFISAYGEESDRQLTFAHFNEPAGEFADKPTLRVLGWDDEDTNLQLDYVADKLHAKLTWPADATDLPAWRKRWSEAFEFRPRQIIDTAEELAFRLAELARRIRNRAMLVLPLESERGELRKLMNGFKAALIHDLDDAAFADMYAQTITYGLFSAAVSRTVPGAGTAVAQDNVVDMVPVTNPFLKEMLQSFLKAGGRKGKLDFDELGIQEVVDLLNHPDTRLDAVLRDFGNRKRGEDPVVHFYEHFLSAYNKKLKVQRGVFYTPQPVVSYIVRRVHELLQTEFGLSDGLADTTTWGEMLRKHPELKLPPLTDEPGETQTISPDEPFVQILDPATGTATFVVEVIDVVYRTLLAKWAQRKLSEAERHAAWNDYVPNHLLPRLHAFEIMMAPYAIAHMKIGLKLVETGYRFCDNERARIYLTNALEPKLKQLPFIQFEALAHEAIKVNEIKWHKRFTVIIGNPPYALYGSNMTPEASRLIDVYRFVQGQRIRERGALQLEKNLQDDYVKFFALAERLLGISNTGILALISNQGYLGNRSLRGMRGHLLTHFHQIAIVDLHGSVSRKKSAAGADENVFDIQQGVAIGVFCNAPGKDLRVSRYADLRGTRQAKYDWLSASSTSLDSWQHIDPQPQEYFFLPFNSDLRAEYGQGCALDEMMPINSSGMVTARDAITVWFEKADLSRFLDVFQNLDSETARRNFQLGDDTKDWCVERAQRDVRSCAWSDNLCRILYRPFDIRWTLYTGQARGFLCNPRRPVLQHMSKGGNVALIVNRQVNNEFRHALVTRNLVDTCTLSSATRETAYVFPLMVSDDGGLELSNSRDRPNFAHNFLSQLAQRLGLPQDGPHGLPKHIEPEDICNYIYALLSSPAYRKRYEPFLKIDFPRLPLPISIELFRSLARLGSELVRLHLLESLKLDENLTEFVGDRDCKVEKISWSQDTVWMDKAQTAGFSGVSEAVWKFFIGGYQVCEKWLKERKGRTLSEEDLVHYQKIIVALRATILLMAEIDATIDRYGGWPGAFAGAGAVGAQLPVANSTDEREHTDEV